MKAPADLLSDRARRHLTAKDSRLVPYKQFSRCGGRAVPQSPGFRMRIEANCAACAAISRSALEADFSSAAHSESNYRPHTVLVTVAWLFVTRLERALHRHRQEIYCRKFSRAPQATRFRVAPRWGGKRVPLPGRHFCDLN